MRVPPPPTPVMEQMFYTVAGLGHRNIHLKEIAFCENVPVKNAYPRLRIIFCKNTYLYLLRKRGYIFTVAQTRHFIKHLLHDFTICSTILQFAPRFYNLLHDFTICSTILQFAIFSTILQFAPRFYNLLHDFIICSTIL